MERVKSAHLPPFNGVGFGTLHSQGCQDFIGPIPQSFLISNMQINNKKTKTNRDFKKKYKFADQSGKIWPIATTKKNAKKVFF